jgi:LacI family transcriptional regulator
MIDMSALLSGGWGGRSCDTLESMAAQPRNRNGASHAPGPAERVGLREVAERAGVAVSSASRVVAGHQDVSPRMVARVRAAIDELGYEPNVLAQSLRRGSTMCIGILMRDISSPLFGEIVLGAEVALQEAGYSTLLTNSHGRGDVDAERIGLLRRRRVDGMLLSLADEDEPSTLAELRRGTQPLVLIDRVLPDDLAASAVLSDHEGALRASIEHLAALGHRRLGLVCGPLSLRPGRESQRAFLVACAEAGVLGIVHAGPFQASWAERATEQLLSLAEPPTALIAASSQIVFGMLRVVRARGLRLGSDVSLIAFEDVPMLDFVDPPIAVVTRQPVEIGRAAAELVLARLAGGPPTTVTVETRFEPRASCGPAPHAHPR